METDELRDEWAERIATFFCGHDQDEPCGACVAKGQHAYDRLIKDDETAITAFRANIEAEDLMREVVRLKSEVKKKSKAQKMGNIWANIMTAIVFTASLAVAVLLLGVLYRGVMWAWGITF